MHHYNQYKSSLGTRMAEGGRALRRAIGNMTTVVKNLENYAGDPLYRGNADDMQRYLNRQSNIFNNELKDLNGTVNGEVRNLMAQRDAVVSRLRAIIETLGRPRSAAAATAANMNAVDELIDEGKKSSDDEDIGDGTPAERHHMPVNKRTEESGSAGNSRDDHHTPRRGNLSSGEQKDRRTPETREMALTAFDRMKRTTTEIQGIYDSLESRVDSMSPELLESELHVKIEAFIGAARSAAALIRTGEETNEYNDISRKFERLVQTLKDKAESLRHSKRSTRSNPASAARQSRDDEDSDAGENLDKANLVAGVNNQAARLLSSARKDLEKIRKSALAKTSSGEIAGELNRARADFELHYTSLEALARNYSGELSIDRMLEASELLAEYRAVIRSFPTSSEDKRLPEVTVSEAADQPRYDAPHRHSTMRHEASSSDDDEIMAEANDDPFRAHSTPANNHRTAARSPGISPISATGQNDSRQDEHFLSKSILELARSSSARRKENEPLELDRSEYTMYDDGKGRPVGSRQRISRLREVREYMKANSNRSLWNTCQHLCKGLGYRKRRRYKYEISELYHDIRHADMTPLEMIEYLVMFRKLHEILVDRKFILAENHKDPNVHTDIDTNRIYRLLSDHGIFQASVRTLLRKAQYLILRDKPGVNLKDELKGFVEEIIEIWRAICAGVYEDKADLTADEEAVLDELSTISTNTLIINSMNPDTIFGMRGAEFKTRIEPISLFMFSYTIKLIVKFIFKRDRQSDDEIIDAFKNWYMKMHNMHQLKAYAFIRNLVKFVQDVDIPNIPDTETTQRLIYRVMSSKDENDRDQSLFMLYTIFSIFYGCALEEHFEASDDRKIALVADCLEKLGDDFLSLGKINVTRDQAVRYFPGIASAMYHRGEITHQCVFADVIEEGHRLRFFEDSRRMWMEDRDTDGEQFDKSLEVIGDQFRGLSFIRDILALPNFGYDNNGIKRECDYMKMSRNRVDCEMDFGARYIISRNCFHHLNPSTDARIKNPFTRHSMEEFSLRTDLPPVRRHINGSHVSELEDYLTMVMHGGSGLNQVSDSMILSSMIESFCASGRRCEDFSPTHWEETALSTEVLTSMIATPTIKTMLVSRICQMITNDCDHVSTKELSAASSLIGSAEINNGLVEHVVRILLLVQNSAIHMKLVLAVRWFYAFMIGTHFEKLDNHHSSIDSLMEVHDTMSTAVDFNLDNLYKLLRLRIHEAYVGHVDVTEVTVDVMYNSIKGVIEGCLSRSTSDGVKQDILRYLSNVDGLSADTVVSQCTAIVHILSGFGRMHKYNAESVDPRFSLLRIAGHLLSLAILNQKIVNAKSVARMIGRPNTEFAVRTDHTYKRLGESLKPLIDSLEAMIDREINVDVFRELNGRCLDLEKHVKELCAMRYRDSVDIIMSETLHAPVPVLPPAPTPAVPVPAPRTRSAVVTFTVKEIKDKPFERHATQSIINGLLQTLVVMCSDERYFKRHFDEELRVYREITGSSGTNLKMFLDDCPDTKEEERLFLDNKLVDYYASRLERRCQKYCNTGMNMMMMIHLTFRSAIHGITVINENLVVEILKRVLPKYPELLLMLFYAAVDGSNEYNGCKSFIRTSSKSHDEIMSIVNSNRSSIESAISTFYVPGRIGEPVSPKNICDIIRIAHLLGVLDTEYMQKVFQKYMPERLSLNVVTGEERSVDLHDPSGSVSASSRIGHGSTPAVAHRPMSSSHGAGHRLEARRTGEEIRRDSSHDKSAARFVPRVDVEAVNRAADEFQHIFDGINVSGRLDTLITEAAAYTVDDSIEGKLRSSEARAVEMASGMSDDLTTLFKIVFWRKVYSKILAAGMTQGADTRAVEELGRIVRSLITSAENMFSALLRVQEKPETQGVAETQAEEY